LAWIPQVGSAQDTAEVCIAIRVFGQEGKVAVIPQGYFNTGDRFNPGLFSQAGEKDGSTEVVMVCESQCGHACCGCRGYHFFDFSGPVEKRKREGGQNSYGGLPNHKRGTGTRTG